MDVFDRYLRTLRLLLPKDQRDDIIRELSEEIRSQVAEREAALGRVLNANEQASVLKQYGHPLVTAARYRPQRYLIGPVVFPFYWLVVKVTVALTIATHVIGAGILLASGAPLAQMGPAFEGMLTAILKELGWITVLAAWADLWLKRSRVLERWNPTAAFPPVKSAMQTVDDALQAVPGRKRVPGGTRVRVGTWMNRGTSISRLIVTIVISAWWLFGLKFPYLFFGPGAATIDWGGAMDRLFPALAIAQLLVVADYFVRLTKPDDIAFVRFSRFIWVITGWFFIYVVATADHQWLIWRDTADSSARTRIVMEIAGRQLTALDLANYVFSLIFVLVAIISIVGSAGGLVRRIAGHRHTTVHA